jgi:hypothetical protein
MARSVDARIVDIRRLLDAARRIVDRRVSIAPALVASTGLSPEGVELALTRHLEVDATDEQLRSLVAHAGHASRVSVILSANVFVGALRALALARAASEEVVVRPSRRDPAFARALIEEAGDPAIRLDEALDVAEISTGELHVYGHDATIADLRARARVPVVAHGSGLGVAWITAHADIVDAARALAEDVVVFDQRGCLSPRIALLEGDIGRADALADALHLELERLQGVVPRGALPPDERAASDRYVATMTYAHRALVGTAHVVGVSPAGASIVASPAYRHVHVMPCATEDEGAALLSLLDDALIAIGSDDVEVARSIAPRWARTSALGSMQRPPLDGPVDLRGRGSI